MKLATRVSVMLAAIAALMLVGADAVFAGSSRFPEQRPLVVAHTVWTPALGSGYVWAQPGTALVTSPYAQPPAWIPIGPLSFENPALGSSYVLAQPGTLG